MKPGTFQKGHDPRRNLNGRPPRKSMTAHLEEAATDAARKKIAKAAINKAKNGDLAAAQFIFDRIDGKVPTRIDITQQMRDLVRDAGLTDEEAEAAIQEAVAVIREATA